MCGALFARAPKTSARHDNDLLMLTVSLSRTESFAVPVRSSLSLPAKSTSLKPPRM